MTCSLAGLRIVVTRATHQAQELAAPLRSLGADVLLAPLIGISGPADPAPLREAAAQCDSYDWIIFTSANSVNAFAAELPLPRGEFRPRIAAIGTATRTVAEKNGFPVSLVPERYIAESLAEAFGSEPLAGKRILIPSAAVTRDVVPRALGALGASVDVVEAYRNVIPAGAEAQLREALSQPYPDWITFASSSAVENALSLGGHDALRNVNIATIGPITSQSARAHGLLVVAEAQEHTTDGLVAAICSFVEASH